MRVANKFMFLKRFLILIQHAQIDLLESKNLRTTLPALMTVFMTASTALISWSLVEGDLQVGYERIRRDPASQSLWYGNDLSPRMTVEFSESVKKALKTNMPMVSDIHVFRHSRTPKDWEWISADKKYTIRLLGRTVAPDDTITQSVEKLVRLNSIKSQNKVPIKSDNIKSLSGVSLKEDGIVVSQRALDALGYDHLSPPDHLTLNYHGQISVPVLGIVEMDFALSNDYLLGESYERKLRATRSDELRQFLRVGPVPQDWLNASASNQLPKETKKLMTQFKWRNSDPKTLPSINKGEMDWEFHLLSGTQLVSQWKLQLVQIEDSMLKSGFKPAKLVENIKGFQNTDNIFADPVEPKDFMAVVLPVENFSQAREIIESVFLEKRIAEDRKDLTIPLNNEVIEQAVALENRARQSRNLVLIIFVGLAFYVLSQLFFIEWIRSERTVPEMALLESIGFGHAALVSLSMLEGFFIAMMGNLTGISFGMIFGEILTKLFIYPDDPQLAGLAFNPSWTACTIISFTSTIICVCCSTFFLLGSLKVSPIERLRTR